MSKSIFIQVTVYDDDSKQVIEQIVEHYNGSYGWEVESMFNQLGQRIAFKVDSTNG